MKRSDLKDPKRKEKLKGIILYSVQEALKTVDKTIVTAETFKNEQLRGLVMQMIEGQLRFAGYISTIAIFGNKFSYEAKSSRHTVSLFEVGKAGGPIFYIMVYDLAYINVPNINVASDAEFQSHLNLLKKDLPAKEGLLCPNKIVTTVKEEVCCKDNINMREVTLKALDDVIEYCVAKQCKDKSYPDNIEKMILGRLYHYAVRKTKDYSWHVFCSEIHDTN